MYILLTIIHVLVCLFLIIVVLLQSGKAADLAGAFGGMGSQTAFGPRGSATLLSKATTISAIVFMCHLAGAFDCRDAQCRRELRRSSKTRLRRSNPCPGESARRKDRRPRRRLRRSTGEGSAATAAASPKK